MDEEEIIGRIEKAKKTVEEKLSEIDQKIADVRRLIEKIGEAQNTLIKTIKHHKRRPPI